MNILYKNHITAEAIANPQRRAVPQQQPRREKTVRHKQSKSLKLAKVKTCAVALSGLLLALATVAQFAFISQLNYQVSQKEQELNQLENYQQQLEVKIMELKSHERIEKYATEELDLKRPSDVN